MKPRSTLVRWPKKITHREMQSLLNEWVIAGSTLYVSRRWAPEEGDSLEVVSPEEGKRLVSAGTTIYVGSPVDREIRKYVYYGVAGQLRCVWLLDGGDGL